MYEIIERPVTAQERSRLQKCIPLATWLSSADRRRLIRHAVADVAQIGVAVAFVMWLKRIPVSFVLPFSFVCLAVIWVFNWKRRILWPLRNQQTANQRALEFRRAVNAAATVRVRRVESEAVVEVLHEGGGIIYLFDVGDGRTYWIDPFCGTVPGRPPDNWPNSQFEVVEVPGWPEELGPFCFGQSLHPQETIDTTTETEIFDRLPLEGVINQSLNAFLQEARSANARTG